VVSLSIHDALGDAGANFGLSETMWDGD
jgi:hypothetical protein